MDEAANIALMFPDLDKSIVEEVLHYHGGDVENTVETLLDLSSELTGSGDDARASQVDRDAQLAIATQNELDADFARRLAQAERPYSGDRQTAASHAAASRPSGGPAAPTVSPFMKSLVSRVRSAGRRAPREATQSLLGAADSASPSHMEPIYVLPQIEPASAPRAYQPLAETMAETMAPTETATMAVDDGKYSARLERARAANAVRRTSRSDVGDGVRLVVAEQPLLVPIE